MTEAGDAEAPRKRKGGRPPQGTGMHLNHDGYLRIHRGPHRDEMAHRAYASRQLQESLGRELTSEEEVHHSCRNRACWPPSDFHLIVMDAALHHAGEGYRTRFKKRKGRGKGNKG